MIKRQYILSRVLFAFALLLSACLFLPHTINGSMKLNYNGKTHKYSGKYVSFSLNQKKIVSKKAKSIFMNKSIMTPYKETFSKGMNVSCTYQSSSKKITLKKNGLKIQMWVGKKKAYANGKKFTLPVAPVKVKYVKAKISRILIPAKSISKKLLYQYRYDSKAKKVSLTSPLSIKTSQGVQYYTKYKGSFRINSQAISLPKSPALSFGGTLMPAESICKKLGVKYSFNEKTKKITLTNTTDNIVLIMELDRKEATINGKKVSTSVIPRQIEFTKEKKTYVYIPASFSAKSLGFSYKWDKSNYVASIHKLNYFSWKDKSSSLEDNQITELTCDYIISKEALSFTLVGSKPTAMDEITVTRAAKTITIVVPNTTCSFANNQFKDFFEIASAINLNQTDSSLSITISGDSIMDYAYSTVNGKFTLLLYDEYAGNYQLKIKRPPNVTFDMVTNTDYYNSKRFVIYIKGNYLDYYKKNPIVINSDVVKSVSVRLTKKSNTAIDVYTKKLQGYKIYEKSSSFVVSVGNPRDIYKKIVVLDAGHGGKDPGAIANKTQEKDLNYKIMYTLEKKLFTSNAPDIKAYWTRTTDTFITLSNRASFAKKVGADLFVSLHMNCWTKSSVNGTEVYYSASNNSPTSSGLTSKKMAKLFLKNLVASMGTKNRGISAQKYTVVHKNTVPAVLLELGFLSGSSDFKKISNLTYQKKAAQTIYNTISQLFADYSTGR